MAWRGKRVDRSIIGHYLQGQNRMPTQKRSSADIRQFLQPHLPELTRRYHIKSLRLFGSYVRKEQKDTSDIDLLVDFEQPPTLFELMDLEEELEEILAAQVDLVTQSSLRGAIGQRILREAVLV